MSLLREKLKWIGDSIVDNTLSFIGVCIGLSIRKFIRAILKTNKQGVEMKVLLSVENGAFTITEDQGKISLNFDESVGGGSTKGIVQGKGSVVLDGMLGIQAGEKLLNAHLPASVVPLATVIEGIANQALAAIE